MIELQKCTDREKWDDYVLEQGGHPLQLWGWGQLKAGHGWTADRLVAIDSVSEKAVAQAQVLVRPLPFPLKAFAYIPRGPVGEAALSEEFLTLLARYIKREHHAVSVAIEPEVLEFDPPQGWQRSANTVLPARTVLLDLTKSESDLLQDMVKKTRQYIRKSASDVTIRTVTTKDQLAECLAIYRQTSRRAGFNLHNDQYYYDVFSSLGDHSPVFAAYENDAIVAFLWLAISETTAFELYGGVNERGQELRANYALKWHAIRKVKSWDLTRYDFGGLINDGISTFKKSWTTDETALAGTFEYPLSPFFVLWNKFLPAAKKIVHKLKR